VSIANESEAPDADITVLSGTNRNPVIETGIRTTRSSVRRTKQSHACGEEFQLSASDPESKLRLLWNHHAIFNGPLSNARCLTGLDEPRSVQSRSTGRKARRGQRGKLCKKRYHAANAIRLIAQPRQKRKAGSCWRNPRESPTALAIARTSTETRRFACCIRMLSRPKYF